jgi:hypothetical protein
MLLRSATTDDLAAERLRTIFRDQLAPAVISLIGDPAEAVPVASY